MAKIGFLGGTFNPPHMGHLNVAYSVMEKLDLDKVVFIPSANPPHKENLPVSKEDRFMVAKLMIKDEPRFEISDLEFKREGKSFTKDTLQELKRLYPKDEIFWMIGMDSFISIPTWEEADGILNLCKFVVVARKGYVCSGVPDEMISKVEFVDKLGGVDISSTKLREMIKEGQAVSAYLSPAVAEFIKEKGLYV